jgi:Tol biopolymer transport system component
MRRQQGCSWGWVLAGGIGLFACSEDDRQTLHCGHGTVQRGDECVADTANAGQAGAEPAGGRSNPSASGESGNAAQGSAAAAGSNAAAGRTSDGSGGADNELGGSTSQSPGDGGSTADSAGSSSAGSGGSPPPAGGNGSDAEAAGQGGVAEPEPTSGGSAGRAQDETGGTGGTTSSGGTAGTGGSGGVISPARWLAWSQKQDTGEARTLVVDVTTFPSGTPQDVLAGDVGSISPDGRWLATCGELTELQVIDLGSDELASGFDLAGGCLEPPTWSADSSTVVVHLYDQGLIAMDGHRVLPTQRVLTPYGMGDFGWEPGGPRLAWQDGDTLRVASVTPQGASAQGAIELQLPNMHVLRWAPRSSRLAVSSTKSGGGQELSVVDLDAAEPTRRLVSGAQALSLKDDTVAWAEASDRILFVNEAGSLFAAHTDGGEPQPIWTAGIEGEALWGWSISPDERWIAFYAGLPDAKTGYLTDLSAATLGEPLAVSSAGSVQAGPTWSPDSSRVVFADLPSAQRLYYVLLDPRAPDVPYELCSSRSEAKFKFTRDSARLLDNCSYYMQTLNYTDVSSLPPAEPLELIDYYQDILDFAWTDDESQLLVIAGAVDEEEGVLRSFLTLHRWERTEVSSGNTFASPDNAILWFSFIP